MKRCCLGLETIQTTMGSQKVLYVLTVVAIVYRKEVLLAIQIPFIRGYAATTAENGRGATKRFHK
jgi:hypothetical protein